MAQARRRQLWIGIWGGVVAAVFYSLANALLRLSAYDVDSVLVSAMKAITTLLCFLPWMVIDIARRKHQATTFRSLSMLFFAALQVQVIGSVGLQIAFHELGVALVVPMYLGTMVVGSAVLGWIFLSERVDLRLIIALCLLVASAFFLGQGATQAHRAIHGVSVAVSNSWQAGVIFGVAAAAITGLTYAVLGVAIRKAMKSLIHHLTPIIMVSAVGALTLGPWAAMRVGGAGLSQVAGMQWVVMVAAGVCNAIGFLGLIYALKRLPVLYVNAINVSQAAMAAICGILFFYEPLTWWLFGGLLIMAIGFGVLANRSRKKHVQLP
jgi:drug/metabolite transporter (DMT)-like permease